MIILYALIKIALDAKFTLVLLVVKQTILKFLNVIYIQKKWN